MWLDVDPANAKFANLYASHRVWVEDAATSLDRNPGSRIVRAARKSLLPLIQCVCSVGGWGGACRRPSSRSPSRRHPKPAPRDAEGEGARIRTPLCALSLHQLACTELTRVHR